MTQNTATAATTSVATTVAAAVGGVVVLSTMFAPTPTIDLQTLDAGHNFVSYTITAEDLQEDIYYFVSGRADGIIRRDDGIIVDEIKCVRSIDFYAPPKDIFIAQLKC